MAGSWESLADVTRFEHPAILPNAIQRGRIEIGAFSYVGGAGSEMLNVSIGRYCSIARGVILGAGEHALDWLSSHPFTSQPWLPPFLEYEAFNRIRFDTRWRQNKRVTIGNDVWIGTRAFVRCGVNIGDGAAIGAHAVVTRDVEPYTVVAGNPARKIRTRFPAELVARLLRVRWWNYDLAEFRNRIDPANVPACLDAIEARIASGELPKFRPKTYEVTRVNGGVEVSELFPGEIPDVPK
jgi:acetyltransferase-like isoleucine patch superfamily enzyme